MRKAVQFLVGTIALFCGVLFFAPSAYAYDYSSGVTQSDYSIHTTIGNDRKMTVKGVSGTHRPTPSPTTGEIQAITAKVRQGSLSNWTQTCGSTQSVRMYVHTVSGGAYSATTTLSNTLSDTVFTFTSSGADIADFQGYQIEQVGGNSCYIVEAIGSPGAGWSYGTGATYNDVEGLAGTWHTVFTVTYGVVYGPTLPYEAYFQSPPFTASSSLSNFSQFRTCYFIGNDSTSTTFSMGVTFGTSSATGLGSVYSSARSRAVGPFFDGERACLSIPKDTVLPIGSYKAQAKLYVSSSTVATSAVLPFSIVDASGVLSGTGDDWWNTSTTTVATTPLCGPTSFSALGTDWGRGICDVTRFLFVPSPAAFDQFRTLETRLASTAPFSYFYGVRQIFVGVQTSPTNSLPTVMLNTGSSTVPINVEIFSANTINALTTTNSRNTLRSMIEWVLWLSFGGVVYATARKLFDHK